MRLFRLAVRRVKFLSLGICSPTGWCDNPKGKGTTHVSEVYGAEILGASMALLAAIAVRELGENIFVLVDNQPAMRVLQSGKTFSCIRLSREFLASANKAEAKVRWVPGHPGIGRNGEVDKEAQDALQMFPASYD